MGLVNPQIGRVGKRYFSLNCVEWNVTRGVAVGLFPLVPVFIVHKYRPYGTGTGTGTGTVFRRRSTKGRILGWWQCWCISPTCSDTCISQSLI